MVAYRYGISLLVFKLYTYKFTIYINGCEQTAHVANNIFPLIWLYAVLFLVTLAQYLFRVFPA